MTDYDKMNESGRWPAPRYDASPITPGSRWVRRTGGLIATVIYFRDGYVRFVAPWTKSGEAGKAEDSFRAHYRALPCAALCAVEARS